MKTLTISPADVSAVALGQDSGVADVDVSVAYDRPVFAGGMWIPRCAKVVQAANGWSCQVLPNDDPSITQGAGFSLTVTLRLFPRRGLHAEDRVQSLTCVVTSAHPDTLNISQVAPPVHAPYFIPGSGLSGVAVWTDPVTNEQIPYLIEPTNGTLTTIGH